MRKPDYKERISRITPTRVRARGAAAFAEATAASPKLEERRRGAPAIQEIDWTTSRLKDRIAPGVDVLFVGINPGVRSAITGHHFAGYSNRFWKLLWDSRLVSEPITYEDDHRLREFGIGITNLIARPTPGIGDLRASEYIEGWKVLQRKIRRYRPRIVALVGVTLYRALGNGGTQLDAKLLKNGTRRCPVVGEQPMRIHAARVFVLPNPSGRNANFTYEEMLDAFRALERGRRISDPSAELRRGSR